MLSCAIPVLLGAALYVITLNNPFVYDDVRTVVDNGSIASLTNLPTIIRHELTRPLTNFSFALDRALWGPSPWGFHLTNVILHAVNIFLVFLLALRVAQDYGGQENEHNEGRALRIATITATLFAVHPLMSEAVAYISSRSDLLATTWILLAFLAARRALLTGAWFPTIIVWPLWIAALLCKETAPGFPPLVWLYERLLPDRSRTAGRMTLVRTLLFAMAFAAAARLVVFLMLEQQGAGIGHAPAGAVLAFWTYIRLFLLAEGQSVFHALPPQATAATWIVTAIAIALLVAAWRIRERIRVELFAAGWFLILVSPAALLGAIDDLSPVAEHRLYGPAIGVFLLTASALDRLTAIFDRARSTRVLSRVAFAAIVLMLCGRTFIRDLVWASPVTLWQEASLRAPDHWLPAAVLGESLHANKQYVEAISAYQHALALRPDNDNARINLVVCLSEMGRFADAGAVVDVLEARRPASPYVPLGRGTIASIQGHRVEARQHFRRVIELDSQNVAARQWLAVMAEEDGAREEALHWCYELQRLAPDRASIDACIARSAAPSIISPKRP